MAKTVEQVICDELVSLGMFSDQAQQVMEMVKQRDEMGCMKGRWNESAAEYPEILFQGLMVSAKEAGLEWIDKNLPKAWFRPMFE